MSREDEVIDLDDYESTEKSGDQARPMRWWARGILLTLTVPWIIVLIIAMQLHPYDENGTPLRLGTHRQLVMPGQDQGLPDCNFKVWTGVPCPSCGMTTSFSLLMHADIWNSMKANFAGTCLVTFGLLFVPWALMSAFWGRFAFIRSLEMVVFRLAVIFLILLFGRWAIVVLLELLNQS